MLRTIQAVESWINTGVKPSVESFPESEGFDHAFRAPRWPQPFLEYCRSVDIGADGSNRIRRNEGTETNRSLVSSVI